jgi:hypothetical protein
MEPVFLFVNLILIIMKNLIFFLVAAIAVFTFASCGEENSEQEQQLHNWSPPTPTPYEEYLELCQGKAFTLRHDSDVVNFVKYDLNKGELFERGEGNSSFKKQEELRNRFLFKLKDTTQLRMLREAIISDPYIFPQSRKFIFQTEDIHKGIISGNIIGKGVAEYLDELPLEQAQGIMENRLKKVNYDINLLLNQLPGIYPFLSKEMIRVYLEKPGVDMYVINYLIERSYFAEKDDVIKVIRKSGDYQYLCGSIKWYHYLESNSRYEDVLYLLKQDFRLQ